MKLHLQVKDGDFAPHEFLLTLYFSAGRKTRKIECVESAERFARAKNRAVRNLIFTLVRAEAKPRLLLRPFSWFSHLSWTMSLLTNEEKERIKGLRCHAEVTKKVKEGKRPVAEHRWWRTFWPSLALVCCSTKSLSSLKRKPPGDKVTKFFLCPFPKTEGAKRTEEKSRRANQ